VGVSGRKVTWPWSAGAAARTLVAAQTAISTTAARQVGVVLLIELVLTK